jgi:hypothetical protein
MLAVILVVGFFVTVRGLLSILAIILVLGGVNYVLASKSEVTFRGAIFNWPLVIVAGFVTLLSVLLRQPPAPYSPNLAKGAFSELRLEGFQQVRGAQRGSGLVQATPTPVCRGFLLPTLAPGPPASSARPP